MNASNLLMNGNDITGIDTISGVGLGDISISSGLNFSTGGGISMNNGGINNTSSISLGSATSGTNTVINQVGAGFNIQNTYPSTSNPSINLTVKNSGGIDRGIIITPTLISPTINIDMNTLNITRMGIGSTAVTQLATVNDTTIATTQYVTTACNAVASALPVYTTTTATCTQGGDMTPVTLFTTAYTSGGYATFVSGAFSLTLNNFFISLAITWASNPWNGYPPSGGSTTYINGYCTTNKTNYSCPILWSSNSPVANIYLPTGAPTANGTNYGFNLQSLGGIRQ
jgi:hypothetical protein